MGSGMVNWKRKKIMVSKNKVFYKTAQLKKDFVEKMRAAPPSRQHNPLCGFHYCLIKRNTDLASCPLATR
jgi:hypothetical protein